MFILFPFSARWRKVAAGITLPVVTRRSLIPLPAKPGLGLGNFFNYYDGNASIGRAVPNAGLLVAGMDATAYSNTVLGLYRTPLNCWVAPIR